MARRLYLTDVFLLYVCDKECKDVHVSVAIHCRDRK